ncbi:MAG: DnaA N-terminal domain-containing protein [Litoreibacter sp.]
MEAKRLVGPESGSLKYDLLTALSITGLHGSTTLQTSMTRLIAIVTARYNWRQDELTVGQRDMAKMWNVDERTVKREIKRLTLSQIIICKRPGVRGRVGAYKLNYPKIAELSRGSWPSVGPDFVSRMENQYPEKSQTVVHVDFVRPTSVDDATESDPWKKVLNHLEAEQPMHFENWFQKLQFKSNVNGEIYIEAPNAFVSRYIESHLSQTLLRAVRDNFGDVRRLVISQ